MSDKIYTEAMLVGEPHINNDGVPTSHFVSRPKLWIVRVKSSRLMDGISNRI